MTSSLKPIAALLLSVAILIVGSGLAGTLLPLRAGIEQFTSSAVGVLGASYNTGFLVGCLVGPVLLRRVGHIRVFATLAAIASAGMLLHALFVAPVAWWLIRLTAGACFAGLYVVIESWLNEHAANENRGRIMSAYTAINFTALTGSQFLLTLADPSGFALFATVAILLSFALVPVALTTGPAPAPLANVRVRILRLYSVSPVGFMGCVAVGLANGAFWALAPLFAVRSGFSVPQVASFMALVTLAGALAQWPIGRLSDRFDRRIIIAGVCGFAALAAVAMVVVAPLAPELRLPLAFVFGFFAMPLYAVSVAHANDFAASGTFVETSSGLLFVYALGAIVGPLVASALMQIVGPDTLFAYTAGVHVLMLGFALYRMRVRARPPEEERVEAVVVPPTSPAVYELMPTPEPTGSPPSGDPPPASPRPTSAP